MLVAEWEENWHHIILPAIADVGALELGIPEKQTATWTALINGFAVNGHAKVALEAFSVMRYRGFKPNEITMIGVLSACNHNGLVKEGRRWFKAMEEFGLTPEIEHCGGLIDLLGRAGCLDEA
ncbi:Pentatricopeptide repeat [Dillenia turbinata]|uniref:Pentatricopeptide repeat n=1 Tax=Dillenia turbinata TaxID=194707 RepID=A0AAN8V0J7_9MAGN